MTKKLLVAYASKAGSTTEVAKAVADELKSMGYEVDLVPAGKVNKLDGYAGVVFGTAIRIGKPIAEGTRFVKKFKTQLGRIPAALFSVGLAMQEDTPENRATAEGFLAPIKALFAPVSIAMFGGKMDYSKLPGIMRMMFSRDKEGKLAEGDWRNWEEIRAWARSLESHF